MYSHDINKKRFIKEIEKKLQQIAKNKRHLFVVHIPLFAEALFLLHDDIDAFYDTRFISPENSLKTFELLIDSPEWLKFLDFSYKYKQKIKAQDLKNLITIAYEDKYHHHLRLFRHSLSAMEKDLDKGFFDKIPKNILSNFLLKFLSDGDIVTIQRNLNKWTDQDNQPSSFFWSLMHPKVNWDAYSIRHFLPILPDFFDTSEQVPKIVNLIKQSFEKDYFDKIVKLLSLRTSYGLLVGNLDWNHPDFEEEHKTTIIDVLLEGSAEGIFQESDMIKVNWIDFFENNQEMKYWKWALWFYSTSDFPFYVESDELHHAAEQLSGHTATIKDLQILLFIWASIRFNSPKFAEIPINLLIEQKDNILKEFNNLGIPLNHVKIKYKNNTIHLSDKYHQVRELIKII